MKNNLFKWIGLFTAILFLAFAASCDSSSSDDVEIPEDVLEAAEGTFELIGEVLLAHSGSPEPGVSITESGSTKTVTLINYSPEYGVTITGNLQIITVSTSPYSFSITGSAVITGELNAEISLEATASWTDGGSPESGPPSAMTGTFTYNGKSYDVIDIMEAMEELEDDDY